MGVVHVNDVDYHISNKLIPVWDKIKNGQLVKPDEDRVYIVDGRERSGKSVFAIQQAAYLDPTFTIDQIVFTAKDFIAAIRKYNGGKAIIFDEAFRGLSSLTSRSKINIQIKTALMEMGQKNLIVFIVLPSFFLLDVYAAILRSHSLFHIRRSAKGQRGFFSAFNYSKKNLLYQTGLRKGWSYNFPHTNFKGRFYNKYPIDERAYRKKKEESLESLDTTIGREEMSAQDEKFSKQRDMLLYHLRENLKMTNDELKTFLDGRGVVYDRESIGRMCRNGESLGKKEGMTKKAPIATT